MDRSLGQCLRRQPVEGPRTLRSIEVRELTIQQVRELTPEGITYAKRLLNDAREGRVTNISNDLLADDRYAKPTATECFVEERRFSTRRDAGKYLSQALKPLGISNVHRNFQLWSWLGMFFFDSLVDRDSQIRIRNLPDYAFVIVENQTDTRDVLAHRLMLAWETYELHGEDFAAWMLSQPVMSIGALGGRLIRSQQRFSSHGIVKLIGILYINQQSGALKRGAGNHDAIGGIRRLNDFLDQLYMTYDVYGMRAEQLLALLPDEFRHFHPDAGTARQR